MKTVEVGEVIASKYRVTRVLGKGGMGLVVAAQHLDLGEALVALKFRLPLPHDTPEAAARFAREALTAARIKNDHVARMHDVGKTADGTPFIVMEYLEGRDLAQVIRESGPLPIEESADLLLQACEAIAEAHTLGIVHRDLKPGNLFVTRSSDGARVVKVLDFGISKTTAADDAAVTGGAGLLGSVLYMSPEQLVSARSVDPRADVWALGVILYEMLAGSTPFAGDSSAVISAAILTRTFSKLSDRRKDVPGGLDEVVSDALTKDREVRLSSVEAFGARLAPFGTDAARASLARIRGIVARTGAGRPGASADGERASGEGVRDAATVPGQSTQPAVVRSADRPEPRPRRWRWAVGVGVAAASVSAVLFARVHHPWSSAAPGAASNAAPVAAASAPGEPASSATAAAPAGCAAAGVAACEASCAAKDPEGCFQLGKILDDGKDAARDAARAATLYQVACDGSVARACNNLGALYEAGDGVAESLTKAVDLFKRGCDLGLAVACANLGMMHYEGKGLPKDVKVGATWFYQACEAGSALGCFNMSIAYKTGQGATPDPRQSFEYAERACKGGMVGGCIRVETARIKGEGVEKDVQGGLAQLDALCTHEAEACKSLVSIYSAGVGTDVPADPIRVRAYAKKACGLGDKEGCGADSLLLTVDKGSTRAGQANESFATKCDAGDLMMCALLGEDLVDGRGVSVDRARGTVLLERACKGKVERACSRLAAAATSSPTASPASSPPSSTASPAPGGRR